MGKKRYVLAIGGGIASMALEWADRLKLPGILVETDPVRREKIATTFKALSYADLAGALKAHGHELLCAYIATPNHTHAPIAIQLARYGIPVMMEKPLGVNTKECKAVLAAYQKSKGWLQIDFEYRFSPLYARAHEIIQSGEIGSLRSIYFEYTVGPYLPSYGWRLDPKNSGGMFPEKLCHIVDLFRFWSGSEPASIHVSCGPRSIGYYHPDMPDQLCAQYHMRNGVYANLIHTHGSVANPIPAQEGAEDWSEFGHRLTAYLNTTEGAISLDIWKRSLTVIRRDPYDDMLPRIIRRIDFKNMPFMESHHDMFGNVGDFVKRAKAGQGPRLRAEDSYLTMKATFDSENALQKAARKAEKALAMGKKKKR